MITGFLCGRSSKKTGGLYDYFRNRIIFPIIDVSGNVIAFGGRVMDNSMPKYLNTSDTRFFIRAATFLPLILQKTLRTGVDSVRGLYGCYLALNAAGFENAVPPLGTAINPEQARIMSRYTKKVIIAMTRTMRGEGSRKGDKSLSAVDLDVRILRLNDAKIPMTT